MRQGFVAVECGTVRQTARPGEYRRDRVGRGLLAPLVHPVVAGHGAVRRFGFHRLAVRSDQHRGHQPQRAEALRDGVRLHVAVVVLAGPYEAAVPFQRRSDHVVDQPVFVDQSQLVHPLLVVVAVDLFENVFETAVVFFQNRIFRAQVQWPFLAEGHVETGVSETADRRVGVVHAQRHAVALEIVHFPRPALSVLAGEGHGQLAGAFRNDVRRAVLIAESVTPDADRTGPSGHQARHVAANDRFAEDRSVEDVADRAVRRLPHLFQTELPDARFVRRNGGALDADVVFFDRLGGFYGNPVVSGIAVLDA